MKNKKIVLLLFAIIISILFISPVFAEQYNNYESATVHCGNGLISKMPAMVPKVISTAYTVLRIAIPIILVIFGMLDLIKGVTSQKDDEIKKGQQIFVKRLIAAAIVFFVFSIVKFLVSVVADRNGKSSVDNIVKCMECFIENKCGN